MATHSKRPVHHRRPVPRRLPLGGRAPRRADAEPRPARRRGRLVPPPLRQRGAVRAEPGVALHGHVPVNHRAAINGTPLDARFTTTSPAWRARSATSPRCSATPTSASTPAPSPPTTRACSRTRACSPASTRCATCPRAHPQEWLAWLRKAGVDLPDDWRAFVDQPADGTRWRTQYNAEHSQTAFLTDRVLDFVDAHDAAPWFVHLSYLRPHPPYLAPAPYDTMYDPALGPATGARADDGRGRPAAPAARRDDRRTR